MDERRLCKVDALLGTETGDLAKKPKSQTLQQPNRCRIGGLGLGQDTAKLHCAERMDQRLANGLRGIATSPMLRQEEVGDFDLFEIVMAMKGDHAEKRRGTRRWTNAPRLLRLLSKLSRALRCELAGQRPTQEEANFWLGIQPCHQRKIGGLNGLKNARRGDHAIEERWS